jgi:uncharacterized membrane protein
MSRPFLDEPARAGLLDAVRAVEAASAAEVVISVRERSGSYRDAALLAGGAAAFLTLLVQLFSPWEFSLVAIQLAPAVTGAVFAMLAARMPPVLRALTPHAERARRVRTSALATFHERGVDGTRERSGLLVYVSLLERTAELVPDRAVLAAAGEKALQAVADRIRAAAHAQDAAGVAAAIRTLADVLAPVLPRGAVVLLAAKDADARPGGGQSFRGGSGGSSGGSSSGGSSGGGSSSHSSSGSSSSSSSTSGEMPGWVALMLVGGMVAFPIVAAVMASRTARGMRNWDSRRLHSVMADRLLEPASTDRWHHLRARDPDFSAVLFDDFLYALYAAAHQARHDPALLERLAPYLTAKVRASLHERSPQGRPVTAVIVGVARVVRVQLQGPEDDYVEVEIESNVTTAGAAGPQAEYLKERWELSRKATALTRPWTGVRTFSCPSCGAPFSSSADGRCASCGQVAGNGRFDWRVIQARVLESQSVPPALTGSTVQEMGTDAPTVVDPGLAAAKTLLAADDPAFSEDALWARVNLIFTALHASWAAQDLKPVRPYVTDSLFNYLAYWVEAYRAQGLTNAVEKVRLGRRQVVRVARDRSFDAITVRLWASGFEVTTDANGTVVGGSRNWQRPYTEYWTLVRGATVRGAPRDSATCPSCGASLAVNMAGNCDHCGVHLTAGEFDWVLSKIEQDDVFSL